MKVLLTGGSGFVAAHCIEALLNHGHDVVVTVRSKQKGDQIVGAHPLVAPKSLSYTIVEDIASEGAFDQAVLSEPAFEAVLHTASPFHYQPVDAERDLLEPAINGTLGLLKAVHKFAPTVKKIVITSSFAAMIHPNDRTKKFYTDADWNPVTIEEALSDNMQAYRASKTFAEKAAWDFVAKQNPRFSILTMCPPLILGPVVQTLKSLESINTSSERLRDMLQGKWRDRLPPTGTFYWVDVRDVALAHVKALDTPDADGRRFIVMEGTFSNATVVSAAIKSHPELRDRLPTELKSDVPDDLFRCDTAPSREILGLKYRSIEETVSDTIQSLQALGL